MGTNLPIWLAWKANLYSEVRFRDRWIRALASILRGFSHDEVLAIFDWGVNTYLVPHYRADIVAEMQQHRQSGTKVVIVSNIFQDFVSAMAARLGADGGIGTVLAYGDNNLATGKIASMPSAGQQKVDNVIRWLQAHQIEVDLAIDGTAYADSISDVPLLATTKYPNATYPDAQLRSHAQKHGWRIIG